MSAVHTLADVGRKAIGGGTLAAALLLAGGCDFEVTNPGPVQDQNLEATAAHEPVVLGGIQEMMQGKSMLDLQGGAIVRDYQAGGHPGVAGVQAQIATGQLTENWLDTYQGWDQTHAGRWILEHAIERFQESEEVENPGSYPPLARAYLWAGFANRVLGEYMCDAVIDGGEPQHYSVHFTRAVEHFENAEQVAAAAGLTEIENAAIAGRAQAHMNLGNWTEAANDAGQVPVDFRYEFSFPITGGSHFIQSATSTFRSVTFWGTVMEDYFPETGDPRVAWGHDPNEEADVARPTYQRKLPMYYPLKSYAPVRPDALEVFDPIQEQQYATPHNMASGREMLLIRAEALLEAGSWPEAMELINEVHTTAANPRWGKTGNWFTGEPLEPLTASSLEEAWEALKFERLIELNLEGRRFGDRKRWRVNQSPGLLRPKEYMPDELIQRYGVPKEPDICWPLPDTEKDANPNVPQSFQSEEIPRFGIS